MSDKPEFIYDTHGDWLATRIGTYIFDGRGDWVGFVEDRTVYTSDGEWVGDLSKDGRILRKRTAARLTLNSRVPPKPALKKADMPGRAPLPMQMAELRFDTIDVLEEDPEVFKRLSDRRPDMD
ncbi:MAG: 4-fold beta flower protein [Aggregatilineales bacterium]